MLFLDETISNGIIRLESARLNFAFIAPSSDLAFSERLWVMSYVNNMALL